MKILDCSKREIGRKRLYLNKKLKIGSQMAKLQIGNEWWTAPAEADNGNLIMVTGRRDMDAVRDTGKYVYRVEITWRYGGEKQGMPDYKTSTLMEKVTDAMQAAFDADPVAVNTGIYTGDDVRNWVFYARSLHLFEKKLNESLAAFDKLPLEIEAFEDPEWEEYAEMRETEILGEDE